MSPTDSSDTKAVKTMTMRGTLTNTLPIIPPCVTTLASTLYRVPLTMAGVIKMFFAASMFMWIAPISILYGFNHNLFPGSMHLSSYSVTLLSGFLAVLSVNVVIALYIFMAMREPSDKHEPDPKFLAEAKASVKQSEPNENKDSSPTREKCE
ncbi:hypothetical protein RJ639_019975 [Escallonia herrerae]|uniref:Vacuolar ATPase assembly integral membrane protein VMA21 homolog n=1 Tax=Escallonia herrerae TaxID=1293975 RepID=A0AA89AIC7_9ASTE|nr:hypothetical protein RJ639_019975 [Escallonia herrerae]